MHEKKLDAAQKAAQAVLDTTFAQLTRRFRLKTPTGLYLWGGVGRGKTWLMDAFFDKLPFSDKKRQHFHAFMRWIHKSIQKHAGVKNPIQHSIHHLAKHCRVLCLDEFLVTDIGDAMILLAVLQALHKHRITLITTSNKAPDDLYHQGLHRDRFLPAIEALKQHCQIFHLEEGPDYRIQIIRNSQLYQLTSDPTTPARMFHLFQTLAGPYHSQQTIEVLDRPIHAWHVASQVVWFDFKDICQTARSALDYLELASLYSTVFISHIPLLTDADEAAAKRFITLVDVFYDASVKLILSAAVPAADLYQGTRWRFDFERTYSRLQEIQSDKYLSSPHHPLHSTNENHYH
jgi:cell division protein ZapE